MIGYDESFSTGSFTVSTYVTAWDCLFSPSDEEIDNDLWTFSSTDDTPPFKRCDVFTSESTNSKVDSAKSSPISSAKDSLSGANKEILPINLEDQTSLTVNL